MDWSGHGSSRRSLVGLHGFYEGNLDRPDYEVTLSEGVYELRLRSLHHRLDADA